MNVKVWFLGVTIFCVKIIFVYASRTERIAEDFPPKSRARPAWLRYSTLVGSLACIRHARQGWAQLKILVIWLGSYSHSTRSHAPTLQALPFNNTIISAIVKRAQLVCTINVCDSQLVSSSSFELSSSLDFGVPEITVGYASSQWDCSMFWWILQHRNWTLFIIWC